MSYTGKVVYLSNSDTNLYNDPSTGGGVVFNCSGNLSGTSTTVSLNSGGNCGMYALYCQGNGTQSYNIGAFGFSGLPQTNTLLSSNGLTINANTSGFTISNFLNCTTYSLTLISAFQET